MKNLSLRKIIDEWGTIGKGDYSNEQELVGRATKIGYNIAIIKKVVGEIDQLFKGPVDKVNYDEFSEKINEVAVELDSMKEQVEIIIGELGY